MLNQKKNVEIKIKLLQPIQDTRIPSCANPTTSCNFAPSPTAIYPLLIHELRILWDMQCYLQHFGGFCTRGTSMRDHQTCSPLSSAISCGRLRACPSVVDSNCAPMHFHLCTFQPTMEGHHNSSSCGGAAMHTCSHVRLTNLPPKCAPTNSSSQLNTTNSFHNACTDSTHAAINKTCNFCSNLCHVIPTKYTTNLLEEPSGSTIHLPGNGESYTSSPSFDYDGDTINNAQVL